MFGKTIKFRNRGIMLLVIGFLCTIVCTITGEQINLLTTILIAETGWTITRYQHLTYGSLVAVAMVL